MRARGASLSRRGAERGGPTVRPEAEDAAKRILEAFENYHLRFRGIARRSRRLFEAGDWRGVQLAAAERLGLYRVQTESVIETLRERLGPAAADPALWGAAKAAYARRSETTPDVEVARTFFNSVGRRLLLTVGVRPETEFLGEETGPAPAAGMEEGLPLRRYPAPRPTPELFARLLEAGELAAPFRDLAGDARRAAAAAGRQLREESGDDRLDAVELLPTPFFRNKGAYLVGRIRRREETRPLILALLNGPGGVWVDAAITSPDEASIVFGFSWSYFHVEAGPPRAVVAFLRSFLPHKRVDELYTSLGYNRHGKTLLFQSLREHLTRPGACFEPAEGTPGMVMSVFTLPSLNVVFKVIKDRIAPPKQTSRRTVRERYRLVFFRDRVGRLADAQEFESVELRADAFAPEVLGELLDQAPRTVRVHGERVLIDHLYTERRLTPLDLYLRERMEAGELEVARATLLDYGRAVKDLAAADIFPGDMLLKNFGVTRHGRVIFYDYDELSLLTQCTFREIPPASRPEEELAEEPWFPVRERDVFPEEFPSFLAIPEPLRRDFLESHGDLFGTGFWRRLQERARAGEIVDFFPYPPARRLSP